MQDASNSPKAQLTYNLQLQVTQAELHDKKKLAVELMAPKKQCKQFRALCHPSRTPSFGRAANDVRFSAIPHAPRSSLQQQTYVTSK